MGWKVKSLRIGELTARSGFSDKTPRSYEEVGVLDAPARTKKGYRDYDGSVLDRLRFVRDHPRRELGLRVRVVTASRNERDRR